MGKVVGLLVVSAVIALALYLMFSPATVRWADAAQEYFVQLKNGLAELQAERQAIKQNQDVPAPTTTDTPQRSPESRLSSSESPTVKAPVVLNRPDVASPDPEIAELRNYMLALINDDRQRHGLDPVVLGNNPASQIHAEDELRSDYFSHWGMNGLLPYMRYTVAGGVNYEGENGFIYGQTGGFRAISPQTCLEEAQAGLMNSPGHRRNILNKWHKKVSLGIAYDRNNCVGAQQFEGDYVEFVQKPVISEGVLSFAGSFKEGFILSGVQVWYDQPPHPLTLGQLDATYSYPTGQQPAAFIREPLTGGRYYPRSSSQFNWESGVDPYLVDPNIPRGSAPTLQTMSTRSAVVPWITADVWEASGQSFQVSANISPVLNDLGPGVYTVLIWGDLNGESVALTNYSIFIE